MKTNEINFTPLYGDEGLNVRSFLLVNKTIKDSNIEDETDAVKVVISQNLTKTTVQIFHDKEIRLGNYLKFGYYPFLFNTNIKKENALSYILKCCSDSDIKTISDSLK